jgi:hypothetical protein
MLTVGLFYKNIRDGMPQGQGLGGNVKGPVDVQKRPKVEG